MTVHQKVRSTEAKKARNLGHVKVLEMALKKATKTVHRTVHLTVLMLGKDLVLHVDVPFARA